MDSKKLFSELNAEVRDALLDLTKDVAVEAMEFYNASFKNQGFTNLMLEKWKARKIKTLYKKSSIKTTKSRSTFTLSKDALNANRSLLIKTGRLRRSGKKSVQGLEITISYNTPYAEIHNNGGEAGRGRKTKIPQRQYVGISEKLNNKIAAIAEKQLTKLFK